MARISIGSPLLSKDDLQKNKDLTNSFKSLKKSLKETLERLETIGVNDFEAPDELTMLKAQVLQKDKIISEQAQQIEKLSHLVSLLSSGQKISEERATEPMIGPRLSKFTDIDQEINNQKKLFANLCSDIGQSLNNEFLGGHFEYENS